MAEFGVCRAAAESAADGLNGGHKGGRICWAIGGTLCGDKLQGTFAQKLAGCSVCEFYQQVRAEQGAALVAMVPAQLRC